MGFSRTPHHLTFSSKGRYNFRKKDPEHPIEEPPSQNGEDSSTRGEKTALFFIRSLCVFMRKGSRMRPGQPHTLKLLVAPFILSFLLLPACAGKKIRDSRPDWIQMGSGAMMDKDQKAFYGIGKTEGILNESLARTTADKMARAEITEIFTIYSAILIRGYIVSIPKDDPDQERKKQGLEQSVKDLSVNPLTDITIVDRWADHSNQITFSLARLNLDRFKSNIQKSEDMETPIRDFIRDNAEKEFDTLEQARRRRR